jgi:hypothetical protein
MVSASSTTQRGSHKNGEAPFTAARRLRCYLVVAQRARLVKRRAAPTARAHPIHLRPERRSSFGVCRFFWPTMPISGTNSLNAPFAVISSSWAMRPAWPWAVKRKRWPPPSDLISALAGPSGPTAPNCSTGAPRSAAQEPHDLLVDLVRPLHHHEVPHTFDEFRP